MKNQRNKARNVPNLRFPGFDDEWEVIELDQTCEIKTGNKDTQNKITGGEYPFFVRSNTVERINSFSYDGEAILTSGDGVGVGKNFHYINGKFDFHQRVYCLRKFQQCYSGKFVFCVFADKFYKRVMRLSAKNSVDSIRMDMIAKMPVGFPRFEEQQKIAAFLTGIDDRINTQIKIIDNLESLKKGIMQKTFDGKGEVKNGECRFIPPTLRFKDDDGSDFPDWKEKKLGKILKIGSGKDYKHLNTGDIPVYGTGGVMTYVDDYLYDGESVGIGRKGTIDKPRFLKNKFWTVDTLFYTYSFINTMPMFIYLTFQNINWKKYNEASGVPSLSKTTIEKIKIQLPSLSEQQRIADFLSSIDKKIEAEKEVLEQYKQQKKYLLQNLFI